MRTFIASTAVLRIGSVALLQRAPLRISKAVARALIVAAMLIVGTARADTVDDTIRAMHWYRPGEPVHFAQSASTLFLNTRHTAIAAADAVQFERFIGSSFADEVEGITFAVPLDKDERVLFQYFPAGYVGIDDWADLDADALLRTVSDNTEKDNAARRERGQTELHVKGWLRRPTLDRASDTVYWSFAATQGGQPLINAIALRLGRHGYEKLTWIGDDPNSKLLDDTLAAYEFDRGDTYRDYVSGDKLAGYGIAALVGAVAGANLAKAAAAGALLLALKKLGFLLLAPLFFAYRWIRGLFKRRRSLPITSPHSEPPPLNSDTPASDREI